MSVASASPPPPATAHTSTRSESGSSASKSTLLDTVKIEFLTDDVLQNWESHGKDNILDMVKKSCQDQDLSTIIALIHEIIITCNSSTFDVQNAIDLMKEILELPLDTIIRLFLHAFSLYNLSDPLKELITALNIDKSLMLLLLDSTTLLGLGLTNAMFEKNIVRTNTTLLYKQKRFNLLREESEGYSKLIVEIYTAAYSKNNLQKVDSTASTILSLIGYFDLDPVKALDVFLDISASNLVAHSRFFIQVLKKSPWWPSEPSKANSIDEIGDGGNSMAAQLLGFKLHCISSSNEQTPENLLMLIAVLIKEGFLSLGGIYPYLDPPDEALVELYDQWKSDMEDRAFMANSSALAMAAPLTDDAPTPDGKSQSLPSDSQESKKQADDAMKYPSYQKTGLLYSLLAVGSIHPALFMLSRFPKIVDPYPEIADLLLKIADYAIEPLYKAYGKPQLPEKINISTPKLIPTNTQAELNLSNPYNGQHRRGLVPIRPITESNPSKFFYEQWSSGIEQITDLDGLKEISETFIRFTGPLLSRNIELLVKLCRIGIAFCRNEKENSSTIIQFWIEYSRSYILSSISLLEPNPGVIQEVFNLFRLFPFETRYSFYGEWQSVILRSSPHLKFASSKAEKDTKNVLKRLSNTNVREMMRKLAKISYSNPISCFKVFIGQVESYDNLATLVVEAARYFTDMGWDVFPFIIMIQMTSGRGTQQMDGLNDRKWIQSLASFTAKLCRRYAYMDLRPLLLFLLRKLHVGDLSFVIVLRELLTQMAGIAQFSSLTTTQVENLGGGSVLRSKVFEAIDDEREALSKAGRRLVDSLISLKTFSEMFIILNQIHQRFIHFVPEDKAHEKVLASRYDDLTHILIQFIEMTTYYLDIAVFKANMNTVVELCIDYGVDVAYAFGIWRQYLGEEIRGFDPSAIEDKGANDDEKEDEESQHWHPVLRSLVRDIRLLYPDGEWEYLKPGFFVTFWQLSLYDIQYPAEKYQQADRKMTESIAIITDQIRAAESSNNREASQNAKQYRTQRDQLSQQHAKLSAESKRHALHFEKSKVRLRGEKHHWFSYNNPEAEASSGVLLRKNITKQLLAKCVLPRALTSPIDAIFCARFIQLLHSIGTFNFSSLTFYDKLFSDGILYGTLLTCTSYEAENLGLFLSEILAKLMQWRGNEKVYVDEGLGKHYTDDDVTFLPGLVFAHDSQEITEASLLTHKNFKIALEKWNNSTVKAVIQCLKSDVYMHRRNAITLLRNMIDVFPAITTQGWEITDAVETISNNEDREDLKLAASAILVHLMRRSKSWIELYDFRDVSAQRKEQLIKQSKLSAKEREKKKGKSKQNSPSPSDQSSTPASFSRRNSRSSLPALRREEKSSANSLPASLPKIPSGPRRGEDIGRPAVAADVAARGSTQIHGAAEAATRQIQGREGRYGRAGRGPGGSEARGNYPPGEAKPRGGSKLYRDDNDRSPLHSSPAHQPASSDSRPSRSGRATPDIRSSEASGHEHRSGGHPRGDSSQQKLNAEDIHPLSRSSSRKDIQREESSKGRERPSNGGGADSRKDDNAPNRGGSGGNQPGRLRDEANTRSNRGRDSPRDSGLPPKGPKEGRESRDRDDRSNNARRERENERERRDKEREREKDIHIRDREREREQHNREREREQRERERERDRDRDHQNGNKGPPRNQGPGPKSKSQQSDDRNGSRSGSGGGPGGARPKSSGGGGGGNNDAQLEVKGHGNQSGPNNFGRPESHGGASQSDDRQQPSGRNQEKRLGGGRRGGADNGGNASQDQSDDRRGGENSNAVANDDHPARERNRDVDRERDRNSRDREREADRDRDHRDRRSGGGQQSGAASNRKASGGGPQRDRPQSVGQQDNDGSEGQGRSGPYGGRKRDFRGRGRDSRDDRADSAPGSGNERGDRGHGRSGGGRDDRDDRRRGQGNGSSEMGSGGSGGHGRKRGRGGNGGDQDQEPPEKRHRKR